MAGFLAQWIILLSSLLGLTNGLVGFHTHYTVAGAAADYNRFPF